MMNSSSIIKHSASTQNTNSNAEASASVRSTYNHVLSPLQQTFSVSPLSLPTKTISSADDMSAELSHPADSTTMRTRGYSRSSSVPNMTRHSSEAQDNDQERIFPSISHAETDTNVNHGTRHSNSSVKHLTCFWWKEKGSCRFSDNDCLYAHRDTGHYTDPPRQLIPGEPALAGRKLDRAMRNLAIAAHRSTSSLSGIANSRQASRPSTPVLGADTAATFNTRIASPLNSPLGMPIQPQYNTDADVARLNGDNQFLRTLVDQNGKEKAIMINTIETLQAENRGMRGELDGLRKAQEQLLTEREGLHKRIAQLESEQPQKFGTTRSVSNPFGAIGRGRMNTEARYLGGLLSDD